MTIRLLVERGLALKAVVSGPRFRIVSPQFQQAKAVVSKPSYALIPAYRSIQTSAYYQNLEALSSYTKLFIKELVLDPYTKNLYFRSPTDNQLVLAEETAFSYLKAEVEELSIFEQSAFSVLKRREEAVALSESSVVTYAANKVEEIAVTEAQTAAIRKPLEELLTVAEAYSSLYGKSQSDSIGVTDVVNVSITFIRQFTESAPLTEFHFVDLDVRYTDVALLTDAASFVYGLNAAPETLSVNDAFDRAVAFARSFLEPVTIQDSATTSFNQNKQDSLLIAESLALQNEKLLPAEEISNVFDTYASSYGLAKSDSFSASDVLTRVVDYQRTFNDAFTLDDAAQINAFAIESLINKTNVLAFSDDLAYGYEKILGDSFGASEQSLKLLSKNNVDSISFTDSSVFNIDSTKVEAITIDESKLLVFTKPLDDSFSTFDQLSSSFSTPKTDDVSLTDSFFNTTGKQLADSFGIFEAISIVRRSQASSVLNVGVLNFGPINN